MSPVNQLSCPVCLEPLPEGAPACPNADCGFVLPKNYGKICREAPPLPIAAVGYSRHGKTHLLAAIVLTLRDLTRRDMAQRVTLEILDEATRRQWTDWVEREKRTKTLPPTEVRRGRPIPMILKVSGLFPARTLLVYDVPGQIFHTMDQDPGCLPVLRDSQIVWLVMSPHEFQMPLSDAAESERDHRPQELGPLFAAYKAAMDRLDAPLEGRSAILVVAKGDKIGGEAAALRNYLDSDPLRADAPVPCRDLSLKSAEDELRHISPQIEEHVCEVGDSRNVDIRNMVNLFRENGMNVFFCVTSALGKDPVPGMQPGEEELGVPWARQRVLDPLIWTLALEKQRAAAQSHLILDGSAPGTGYPFHSGRPLPQLLWERLPRHKGVRTWFLGRFGAATSPGQAPPPQPPRTPRPRLIGALLDPPTGAEGPTGRCVLVTDQVVTDLQDFRHSDWSRRLLLVTNSDRAEVREQWPSAKVIQSLEDLDEVVEFMTKNR
jgi:hypothetical protein